MYSLLTDSGHHIHNILFGWRLAFGVVGGGLFHLPHSLFCSTLLYNIHFSSSVTNRFKNVVFLYVEIWSRRFFILLWNANIKITSWCKWHSMLIWIFFVWWLSPALNNIDYSQLMSQFDCCQSQLAYPTMEHCLVRNLQHETLQTTFDMFNQSQHCTNLFCVSVMFYLFWNKA